MRITKPRTTTKSPKHTFRKTAKYLTDPGREEGSALEVFEASAEKEGPKEENGREEKYVGGVLARLTAHHPSQPEQSKGIVHRK
jgi:hypothetical protein